MRLFFIYYLLLIVISCQRAPMRAPAADPTAAKALAPMGSPTNNAALAKKLEDFEKTEKSIGVERNMKKAELYFSERRFIESAHLLSAILDENPHSPGARNLLARCFYFLGNPDRALLELAFILENANKHGNESLDALYLTGAVVLEGDLHQQSQLKRAIGAWNLYLKLAKDSPYRSDITKGLKILEKRMKT